MNGNRLFPDTNIVLYLMAEDTTLAQMAGDFGVWREGEGGQAGGVEEGDSRNFNVGVKTIFILIMLLS